MSVNRFGAQSMVDPIKRVIVRKPDEAFGEANPKVWHYTAQPSLQDAVQEHKEFVALLAVNDVEIIYHDIDLPNHADAIFVHDPVIVCNEGAIILRMGKELRKDEPEALKTSLEKEGIPIHFELHGDALAEGGDLLWIDENRLAVGQGYRTNREGLRQLRAALPDVEVFPVELPYFLGPEACLHLMSLISIVDNDLAVIYKPLIPVPFLQFLENNDFRFVEVPEKEFASMGSNVLAIAPGQCLMLEGNPGTQQGLIDQGCEVATYKGNEISLKAEGGATCLTRPVWRGD